MRVFLLLADFAVVAGRLLKLLTIDCKAAITSQRALIWPRVTYKTSPDNSQSDDHHHKDKLPIAQNLN